MRRLIQIAAFTVLVASFTLAQHQGGGHASVAGSRGHGPTIITTAPVQANQALFGPPASIFSPQAGLPFGPPPSVTSLGPTGYTFAPCVLGNCGHFRNGFGHNFGFQGYIASYPVVIPLFATPDVPLGPTDQSDNMIYAGPNQDEIVGTQGGSPIMYPGERHVTLAHPNSAATLSDERPRSVRADDAQQVASVPRTDLPPQPPTPQETTVLVFKDGHKLDVTNYAIQGGTLFNFSREGPRRVAISDLDVKATVKANDDNGVQFRLP